MKYVLMTIVMFLAMVLGGPASAEVVDSPSDVPAGAVEDSASTYNTPSECDKTRSWTLTVPGEFHEAVTHQEFRYKRDVAAVEEVAHWTYSKRTRTGNPGEYHDEVSHPEYQYSKFTQTKSRTWVKGTQHVDHWWNWSPNDRQGPQDYVPDFPNDPRGTWQGPRVNGGPSPGTYGTFQQGNGNSSWFHREHITDYVAGGWGPWSDFSAWEQWLPVIHTSWQVELNVWMPIRFHWQWQEGNTQYYRQWTERPNGIERTVVDEEAYTDPDTFGPWSDWVLETDTLEDEADLPLNDNNNEYRIEEKEITVEAVPAYIEYYVENGEPSKVEDEASWVRDDPEGDWVQFDERTVIDTPEYTDPDVVTHYEWSNGKQCPEQGSVNLPSQGTGPWPDAEPTQPTPTVTPDAMPDATPTTDVVLPNTGGPNFFWAVLGILLITVGTGVVIRSRR